MLEAAVPAPEAAVPAPATEAAEPASGPVGAVPAPATEAAEPAAAGLTPIFDAITPVRTPPPSVDFQWGTRVYPLARPSDASQPQAQLPRRVAGHPQAKLRVVARARVPSGSRSS